MSASRILTISCLAMLGLAGCTERQVDPPPAATDHERAPSTPASPGADMESPAMPRDLQSIVDAAKADAVSRLAIRAEALSVQSASRVTWTDGSLGCPEPGMLYTQALVPGWRVILRAGDRLLDYHAAANGHLILCPPERAVEPGPDQSA